MLQGVGGALKTGTSEILFLSHRIPYPPNKGDKIRSWHLLSGLAKRHTVHLGTFVDDPEDWVHVPKLKQLCGETCIRPLSPVTARLQSLFGFLTGEELSVAYYRDGLLASWVGEIARRRPLDAIVVFSSSVAQFAEVAMRETRCRTVIDLCDVESDKWSQYASSHGWPLNWIYRREGRLSQHRECKLASRFDATLVIAESEAAMLRPRAAHAAARIHVVSNGVDTGYFDASVAQPNPLVHGGRAIVFTGVMDYHPNVDGVEWFAHDVLPRVRHATPDVVFYIVGSNPSARVRKLAQLPSVYVTGRVPDVRPYLKHAAVVVAPLRIACGVQNKVLEALSMEKRVVATPSAVRGIADAALAGVDIVSDAEAMAAAVAHRIGSGELTVPQAREFVRGRFAWSSTIAAVEEIIGGLVCPAIAMPHATELSPKMAV